MRNKIISKGDFERILRASEPFDRALFILAAETGFRIDDLLCARQWQMDKPLLTLTEHKTKKERTVVLSQRALSALEVLKRDIPHRHPLAYFFPTRRKQTKSKLHRSTADRRLQKILKQIHLDEKGYTIHSLRKVYARNLYEKTRSVLAVSRDLGHATTATTLLYIFDDELL